MIKTGIIGYGYSAKTFHIPLITTTDGMELLAISSSRADAVTADHPSVAVFDSADELILSKTVDLVVITTPNQVHFSLAKLCLERGLHVVVEKPMVTTVAEAEALVALAQRQNLMLSVFHNRRWDGDFLTIKKLVQNNTLGAIKVFESHFDRFRPIVQNRWREAPGPASGIWYDLGSHLVDQAIALFGLPDSLTARCLPMREGARTTDYFHVQLHYENLEVILHASSYMAAPNNRFRLEGSQGSYVKDGLDPQEAHLKQGLTPLDSAFGVEESSSYGKLYTETLSENHPTEVGSYQHYYQGVVASITSNDPELNPVKPVEVVEVMRLLELAEESSAQGKTMVVKW